ncbi:MAG: glycine C-acetyltransferase [Candidatus Marinimicrobia bacterium]|nr:glycine C-acetyltransferase [Candidatus Neomarinimicrobiota bacterium]|tara:strand:- start:4209 stop:5393 length:1185 start_codon:yes stop_codon:yes gene_type:complete
MKTYQKIYLKNLDKIKKNGLFKKERIIKTPQAVETNTFNQNKTLNFCANNYLGLANHPQLIKAAKSALDSHGFGMASVRFICGTQDLHITLEKKISQYFGTDDTILYSSCFDANGGLFETILNNEDAIISDELNHASIIDGIRLSKANRFRYDNNDMADLEKKLIKAKSYRLKMIATDGVFSMDGHIAKLNKIVQLAEKYNAMVMVDDSHATGLIGKNGRGTAEYYGVMSKIDIITSTLGKALGGASGGFTTGKKEVINLLRQKSRPYLFSNSVAPAIVAAGSAAFDILETNTDLKNTLEKNTYYFREKMKQNGFDILDGIHPIIPIMLYDAKKAKIMSSKLLDEGIYVIGFSYPVVPKNKARIRVQISAAMDINHLDKGINAFKKVGKEMGII